MSEKNPKILVDKIRMKIEDLLKNGIFHMGTKFHVVFHYIGDWLSVKELANITSNESSGFQLSKDGNICFFCNKKYQDRFLNCTEKNQKINHGDIVGISSKMWLIDNLHSNLREYGSILKNTMTITESFIPPVIFHQFLTEKCCIKHIDRKIFKDTRMEDEFELNSQLKIKGPDCETIKKEIIPFLEESLQNWIKNLQPNSPFRQEEINNAKNFFQMLINLWEAFFNYRAFLTFPSAIYKKLFPIWKQDIIQSKFNQLRYSLEKYWLICFENLESISIYFHFDEHIPELIFKWGGLKQFELEKMELEHVNRRFYIDCLVSKSLSKKRGSKKISILAQVLLGMFSTLFIVGKRSRDECIKNKFYFLPNEKPLDQIFDAFKKKEINEEVFYEKISEFCRKNTLNGYSTESKYLSKTQDLLYRDQSTQDQQKINQLYSFYNSISPIEENDSLNFFEDLQTEYEKISKLTKIHRHYLQQLEKPMLIRSTREYKVKREKYLYNEYSFKSQIEPKFVDPIIDPKNKKNKSIFIPQLENNVKQNEKKYIQPPPERWNFNLIESSKFFEPNPFQFEDISSKYTQFENTLPENTQF